VVALIAAIAWMFPAAAAEDQDLLTLDNIFGAELFRETVATKMIWLPDGSSFLFRDRGEAGDGLWSYDLARGSTTQVVDWDELAERLAELRPAYEKPAMNDVNRHPGIGNQPTIDPQGRFYLGLQRNDLFAVDLSTGVIRVLTDDPLPELYAEFSPDGRRVAYARDGDLYWLDFATGAEHRLTDRGEDRELFNGVADWVYEEELDVKRSFWWSPDSAHILFVQYDVSGVTTVPITDDLVLIPALELQKYAKAGGANARVRLGVLDANTGQTTWIPTGVGDGYVPRAGWLPDGSGVWYQILNRLQNRLELRAATPGEGSSRLILAEQDEAWVNLRDDLHFVDRGQFVWSSERDGWRHLYLYDLEGGLIRRLSSGEWQVEKVYGLDSSRDRVIFQANAEDPRERHIYGIALNGGDPELLTEESGTHSALLSPDGRHIVYPSPVPRGSSIWLVDLGEIPGGSR